MAIRKEKLRKIERDELTRAQNKRRSGEKRHKTVRWEWENVSTKHAALSWAYDAFKTRLKKRQRRRRGWLLAFAAHVIVCKREELSHIHTYIHTLTNYIFHPASNLNFTTASW